MSERDAKNTHIVCETIDRRLTEFGEVQLQHRGEGIYEIIYNGVFLIASYNNHSEKVLAKKAIERLMPKLDGYQILIGGLGMGFTLQEVLACSQVSRAFAVEIEQAVIDWNRNYLSNLNGEALDDPRTVLIHSDLFDFLHQTQEHFDAVLIDVDNAPNWLALERNERLYDQNTLRRIKEILTHGGILATWSAQEDEKYLRRLENVFSQSEEIKVKETVPKEGESFVYIAKAGS